MKMLLAVLMLLPVSSHATLGVKSDLTALPHSGVAREARDGNWLATMSWAPEQLQLNGKEILHLGILQGWRVNQGDPATCLLLGVPTGSLGSQIDKLNAVVDLPGIFRPLAYVGQMISVDGFAGRRFQHVSPDVHAFVYGVNFMLQVHFGDPELKAGL